MCTGKMHHLRRARHGAACFIAAIILAAAIAGPAARAGAPAPAIVTQHRAYGPNADIIVTYSGGPGYAQDWIAFYREGAPDGSYLTYQYLNGSSSGTLHFRAPEEAGNYVFRLFENNGYKLLAVSAAITVGMPVELDPTFGRSGWVRTDFLGNGRSDWICALSVLNDGKILAAGTLKTGLTAPNGAERNEIALARFNPDGTFDQSFGTGGKVHTELTNRGVFPLNYARASAMVVLGDGRFIVGGSTDDNFVLVRYLPDGTLDESFGSRGIVVTDIRFSTSDPIFFDALRCLAVTSDGKLLAGGATIVDAPYSPGRLAVARYLPNGWPDSSFNFLGKLSESYQSITGHFRWEVNSLDPLPDGNLLAGITAISQFGASATAIARYKVDGSLDQSFGTNGLVIETRPDVHNSNSLKCITRTSTGDILALGSDNFIWFLSRYSPNGAPVSSFGTAGQVIGDFGTSGDIPAAMLLLPDDQPLLAMNFDTFYGLSVEGTFGLARYSANGVLEPAFGMVRLPLMDGTQKLGNQVLCMAMQPDGKVLLAGFTENGQQVWDFTLARVILKPITTGIDAGESGQHVQTPVLLASYPNPIRAEATIEYLLPDAAALRITVHDALGRRVATLFDGARAAGRGSVRWNGASDAAVPQPSGIYFCRIECAAGVATRTMVLMR